MPGRRVTRDGWVETAREHLRRLRFRFLKRIHRRGKRVWWAFNRSSVARGVAVGLFCGVMTPVAQILFAVFLAILVRANLLAATAATFVTNPITLPFVYYYAYRIGSSLTHRQTELAEDLAASEEAAEQALDVADWYTTLLEWASSIALPFLVGLILLASLAAMLGYLFVHIAWATYDIVVRRSADRA